MRLGGVIVETCQNSQQWVEAHQRLGFRAAYCPIQSSASDQIVEEYFQAAQKADLIIAEVGAWSNPLDANEERSRAAILHCQQQLELAERIGARCCVNISGSCGAQWDGPHPDNLTDETFDRIVEITRQIIDAVKPERTFYTLEMMAWAYPDSADSYLSLIHAIDRKQFAVHLDPVNIVSSPWIYYHTGDLVRECFKKLGPYIKSCHAKDITFAGRLTVHLDEILAGLGGFDYRAYLEELSKLDPDAPLMLEHLANQYDYSKAADHIRQTATECGLSFV